VEDAGEDDFVGESEAFDQFALEDVAAEGVGAGFEHGPETAARVRGAKGAEGLANGGGVVGEVVDDDDAVDFHADFKATADAAERGERLGNGLGSNSLPCRERGGGRGIERVVFTGHGEGEHGPGLAGAEQTPVTGAVLETEIGEAPGGISEESVTFNVTKSAGHAFGDVLRGNDAAAAGDEIDEAFEGGSDRVEVRIDVGMVELDVGEDEGVGKIVHELRALIEESRVVLVAFDDEGAAVAQMEAGAEVFRDATDEE